MSLIAGALVRSIPQSGEQIGRSFYGIALACKAVEQDPDHDEKIGQMVDWCCRVNLPAFTKIVTSPHYPKSSAYRWVRTTLKDLGKADRMPYSPGVLLRSRLSDFSLVEKERSLGRAGDMPVSNLLSLRQADLDKLKLPTSAIQCLRSIREQIEMLEALPGGTESESLDDFIDFGTLESEESYDKGLVRWVIEHGTERDANYTFHCHVNRFRQRTGVNYRVDFTDGARTLSLVCIDPGDLGMDPLDRDHHYRRLIRQGEYDSVEEAEAGRSGSFAVFEDIGKTYVRCVFGDDYGFHFDQAVQGLQQLMPAPIKATSLKALAY
jgi:hypothetical protein